MVASNDDARLPATLIPTHYDLTYDRIDLVNHTFEGRVSIEGSAATSVSSITLHALDVVVYNATLKSQGDDKMFKAEEFKYHKRNQTLEMIWSEKEVLKEGSSFVLILDFKGILNDQMRGLYRSTFVGMDGKHHTMATTQFEPTDARRAFPCFDEPALKASFCLTVTIPTELSCISNTPISSMHTNFEGATVPTKTITFQKTPKMSSYLLAMVMGPQMDGISSTSRQIVTTIYTVPGKARQGEFCLDVASRCLDLYQDIFKIPYPLVKSDLLAIPDFAAGAMENWGCVTYREAKILVKPNSTSESMKRGIARTVCHELAHQWFGNLVTMEWWTQLWLNEGVARFMEFVGIDALFPEWDAWTEFVQSVYGLALSLDAMESSHAVEVVVNSADEINEIFDAISYAKGASIIRMISTHLGMDTFMEGMRLYLSRHAYGNAVTNDLWRALEDASGFPVAEFMKPWTLEVGYPILLLSDDGSMTATRFLGSGPETGTSTRWPIPVTAKVEGLDEIQGPWVVNGLDGEQTEMQLSEKLAEWSASGKWFKLNINQTAFFRTAYTKAQWQRLAHVMSPGGPLSVTDRLGLISDSFAAGKAGYSSIVDSLALVKHFGEHETADYAVWQELSENLSGLASVFRSEPFFVKFQAFLKQLYSSHLDRLGWDANPNESPRTGSLRATVISMLATAGDEDVMKEAYERFMAFYADPEGAAIHGDLQHVVFRCAITYDEDTVFEALKIIYERPSTFPEIQRNCLNVMGHVKDPKRHASMLDYIFFSGKVRLQDFSFPLNSLSGTSDAGGRATWQYLKDNHQKLHGKLESGPMWGPCVGLSSRGLTTMEEADEVERYFESTGTIGSAKRRLTQGLEVVRTRAQRRDRDRGDLEQYLDSKTELQA